MEAIYKRIYKNIILGVHSYKYMLEYIANPTHLLLNSISIIYEF